MLADLRFRLDCDALVESVQRAARIEWMPYCGDTTEKAIWWVRWVVREARRLGLVDQDTARRRGAA